MAETASAVIVGGGIVGLSTAWHLARMGCTDVVVLDKEPILVSGSTARSAGGIRLQFSSEANILLSWYGLELFKRFEEELGVDIAFRQVGYLFLLDNEKDAADFQGALAVQRKLGVPSRWLTPGQIVAEFPWVDASGLVGGTYCPEDGHADPYTVAMAFGSAAREMGARIHVDRPCTGILIEHGRVKGVQTPRGEIHAPVVINAAGAYSGQIGQMAGVEVPVAPQRRQVFVSEPFEGLPMDMPLTIDFGRWCWARREQDRVIFGMSDPDEPLGSFKLFTEEHFMFRTCEAVAHRLPAMAEARVGRGWAGLYEVSPDRNGIVGPTELPGFFVASGFSGHGFQQGPGVGRVIAELVLGKEPFVDISELSIRRFREGWQAREAGVV